MICGLILLPFSHSFLMLLIALGFLLSGGIGAVSFGIVMGAVTPALGEKRAAIVSGFVSASAGLVGTILSPAMQQLIAHIGLKGMLWTLCLPIGIMLPVTLGIGCVEKKSMQAAEDNLSPNAKPEAEAAPTFIQVLKSTIRDRSFLCVAMAFFTCGFHMSIIETHLYSQYVSYGASEISVAAAFSIYGIAAMLGCIFTGCMDTRFPNKYVLGCTYASRIFIAASLLFLPKTAVLMFITAFLFGFTGNATVPPTSSVLTKLFGARKLGVLFGIAYLFHRVGAFFSSWLGGICVKMTGNYVLIWIVSMCFSAGAAALVFSIRKET